MAQINGNTYEALSPSREITIEGKKYDVRTRVVYENSGRTGTIDSEKPIQYEFQYKQKPDIGNPFPDWIPLATRSEDKTKNNGWIFTNVAGPGFKKELVETGQNSLTSQMDSAAQNALAKDANVPVARAQQALGAAPNKALPSTAADQSPNAPAGGGNVNQVDPEGGSSEAEGRAPNPNEDKSITADIESSISRDKFNMNLTYPLNLKKEHQDVIKFSMKKFNPREIKNEGEGLNPFRNRKGNQETIGIVFLPIPSGITDTNAANWGGIELDPFKAMGIDIAQSGIVKGIAAGVESAGAAANNVSANSGDAATAFTSKFVEAATGTSNLLSRTQGAIINPNLELLFQGPTLRPFNFTFKLSARSPIEAQAIRSIIRFFKQGMSPIRSKSNLFLKAPHTFQIQYLHKNQPHNYLNKFKECALQSFSVDYTPEGQYATFSDGAMVSYQITMQFQELEPIFNDDYTNGVEGTGYDTEIGF